MDTWILDCARQAVDRMTAHAALVDLQNTDEATFRSFFMAAVRDRDRDARLETEWFRFDLLVRCNGSTTLIEFKYYISRRSSDLDGKAVNGRAVQVSRTNGSFGNVSRS